SRSECLLRLIRSAQRPDASLCLRQLRSEKETTCARFRTALRGAAAGNERWFETAGRMRRLCCRAGWSPESPARCGSRCAATDRRRGLVVIDPVFDFADVLQRLRVQHQIAPFHFRFDIFRRKIDTETRLADRANREQFNNFGIEN